MFDFLQSIFDVQSRTLGRYEKVIARINELEDTFKKLSDSELKAKTAEFKKRRETGETLELLLPEAFATVREAAHRVLGMRHYDVQLMAGIAFHEGKVAEQKTGEGKNAFRHHRALFERPRRQRRALSNRQRLSGSSGCRVDGPVV
ncbi:hypothetical protein LRY65_05200 [Candidatus Woesebacteria bacterium]|nr:hypothetical protein [Candidatus Woesebacteria bacterium]